MFDLIAQPYDLPDAMARATWLGRLDGAHHVMPMCSAAIVMKLAPSAPAPLHEALQMAYEAGYWSAQNLTPAKSSH